MDVADGFARKTVSRAMCWGVEVVAWPFVVIAVVLNVNKSLVAKK